MFWITLGALPTVIKPRVLAIGLTCALLVLEGVSMVTHNWAFYRNLGDNISTKLEYQNQIQETAQILTDAGASIIYGSYLDVIPIAYGSSNDLHPISFRYNRFPLSSSEASQIFSVAIKAQPSDPWGEESLAIVQSSCSPTGEISAVATKYELYECLGSDISGFR